MRYGGAALRLDMCYVITVLMATPTGSPFSSGEKVAGEAGRMRVRARGGVLVFGREGEDDERLRLRLQRRELGDAG